MIEFGDGRIAFLGDEKGISPTDEDELILVGGVRS